MNQLCIPHKSYLDEVAILMKANVYIHGLAHITGGGFDDNINRILPDNLASAIMTLNFPIYFRHYKELGICRLKL